MNTMHMDTMLLAVGEPSVDPAISLGSLVVGGIISVIALAIFIWAIVRVIQLRDVDVYGLPWVVYRHEYDERANRENLGTNRNPIQSANLRLFL